MESLLRFKEVEKRTGLKRSFINDLVARGEFPPKVKIGKRAVAFVESAVDEWIQDRIKSGTVQ